MRTSRSTCWSASNARASTARPCCPEHTEGKGRGQHREERRDGRLACLGFCRDEFQLLFEHLDEYRFHFLPGDTNTVDFRASGPEGTSQLNNTPAPVRAEDLNTIPQLEGLSRLFFRHGLALRG